MSKYQQNTNTTLPPEAAGFMRRERIDRLLEKAVVNPVAEITAGAGFGKTQALTCFLRGRGLPSVYLRLTVLDNYSTRFWHNFTRAAAALMPDLPDDYPETAAHMHDFLRTLGDTASKRTVLVFDDLHVVSEPLVIDFIRAIIDARLDNVNVILSGRSSALFARDAYVIGENELLFTHDEQIAYLMMSGADTSRVSEAELEAATGGWAAALYPVAAVLASGGDLSTARAKSYEIIERAIMPSYSEAARRALIALAVYDRIPADAVRQAIGDETDVSNPFFAYDASDGAYLMHDILRGYLRSRQHTLERGELDTAYRAAAEYYKERGELIDALASYEACRDYDGIWGIIAGYDIGIPMDVATFLLRLLEGFPDGAESDYPLLPVVKARLRLNNGDRDGAERSFIEIIEKNELNDDARRRAAAGEAYLFMGMISLLSFDERYVEYFKRADSLLPGGSTLIDGRLTFAKGNYMILVDDPSPGSVKRHVDSVSAAMHYGVRAMNGAAGGVRHVTAAEAAYYSCDMRTAEFAAYEAIFQAERGAQYDTICAAAFVLLRIHIAAGHYAKASACLADVRERLKSPQNAACAAESIYTRDIMNSWYYSRLGETDKVSPWIYDFERRDETLLPNNLGRDLLIRACCLLETERTSELMALVNTLMEYYDARRLLVARIETRVFKAVAENKAGNLAVATSALEEAYFLAEGNMLFMPFIELGRHMRAVIYSVKKTGTSIPDERLSMLNSRAATYEKNLRAVRAKHGSPGGTASFDLTPREREVLRLLCSGLTSTEISGQIYVSESTVKKVLGSVYDKLGASGRAEAVRIAINEGLIK